jgi:hypothetical protein
MALRSGISLCLMQINKWMRYLMPN